MRSRSPECFLHTLQKLWPSKSAGAFASPNDTAQKIDVFYGIAPIDNVWYNKNSGANMHAIKQ